MREGHGRAYCHGQSMSVRSTRASPLFKYLTNSIPGLRTYLPIQAVKVPACCYLQSDIELHGPQEQTSCLQIPSPSKIGRGRRKPTTTTTTTTTVSGIAASCIASMATLVTKQLGSRHGASRVQRPAPETIWSTETTRPPHPTTPTQLGLRQLDRLAPTTCGRAVGATGGMWETSHRESEIILTQ